MSPETVIGWIDVADRMIEARWSLTLFLALMLFLLMFVICHMVLRMMTRHKVCEWKLKKVVEALLLYIDAHPQIQKGRRAADGIKIHDMLEHALNGPMTPAERADMMALDI